MNPIEFSVLKGSLRVRRPLEAYLARVLTECPGLTEALLRTWSTSMGDAVLIHELLDSGPDEVDVLDVGTFLGVSAFIFSSHPRVRRVVTVDPNPLVADEINEKQDTLGVYLDPAGLTDRRVHDIARSCLSDFPDAAAKIDFVEGGLRGPDAESQAEAGFALLELPDLGLDDPERPLITLIDGLHTAEGVYSDLSAVLSVRPDALVLLDDCRHFWGPVVQAGVAHFLSDHAGDYQFHLFADLSPSLSGSPLAVLFHDQGGRLPEAIGRVLSNLSTWLDPMLLLEREQALIASASAVFEREHSPLETGQMLVLRKLESEVAYLRLVSAEAQTQTTNVRRDLANVSSELTAAHAQLDAVQRSASWRLTAPLRRFRSMLRRSR